MSLRLAKPQHRAVSRRQLLSAGAPRWFVRRELKAGRWQRAGRQVVVLHNGPLSDATKRSAAVLEVGPRAALAGVPALQEAGLSVQEPIVHVIVPAGGRPRQRGVGGRRRPRRPERARVHESRRASEEDLVDGPGVRRVKPAVAAVQAALWARSDRRPSCSSSCPCERGIVTVEALAAAVLVVRRDRRRRLLLRRPGCRTSADRGPLWPSSTSRATSGAAALPQPERQVRRARHPARSVPRRCRYPPDRPAFEITAPGRRAAAAADDLVRDIDVQGRRGHRARIPLAAYWLDREQVRKRIERLRAPATMR